MGLESGTYIDSLEVANPLGADEVNTVDDHLRLIKSTIKNTFPDLDGAMTATQAELNYNDGAIPGTVVASTTVVVDGDKAVDVLTVTTLTVTTLNDGAGEVLIPAGTKMSFFQAAAPNAGWVIDATHNNKMLRVVDTTGGGSGGSDSPIQMTGAQVPQHAHGFTTDAGGVHGHTVNNGASLLKGGSTVSLGGSNASMAAVTVTVANSASHTHTGTSDNNGSNATWDPYYIDVIICTKQ